MKLRQWTVVVIGLAMIGLILYDIYAMAFGGNGDTISEVVNDWAYQDTRPKPLLLVGFGSIVGGLMVHFFNWRPNNSPIKKSKVYTVCILENDRAWEIYGTNLLDKEEIASTMYEELAIIELKQETAKFVEVTRV